MQHPVFINKKSVSVYFGLWAFLAGAHFSVFYFVYKFPIEVSLTDSFINNLSFCIIGISMWFVVRYSIPDQKQIWSVLFNHLAYLTITLVVWTGLSITILNLLFSNYYILITLVYYIIIYSVNLQEKAKIESRLREVLKETELTMLKSQINPHFLFNSLNSISSLTITNPEKARDMVIKLSDFLRYSVSTNSGSFTTLQDEMLNIRRYLEIEKVRFGDKLLFSFGFDEELCRNHRIPVMLLQPLFENAIKHGVYESTEQVSIEMSCQYVDGYLEIKIVNDFDPDAHPRKGAGLGLNNIRERLRLTYKNDKLLTTRIDGSRFTVVLSIPSQEIKEIKASV